MSHMNLKTILPAAILLGGFLVCTTASYGTAGIRQEHQEGLHFLPRKGYQRQGNHESQLDGRRQVLQGQEDFGRLRPKEVIVRKVEARSRS